MNNPYSATTADLSTPGGADATYQPKVFAMSGRIGRVRYIAYSMAILLTVMLVMGVLAAVIGLLSGGSQGAIMTAVVLAYVGYIVGAFILTIRRAHDMGHSGWMSLLVLVPLVSLWFLFAPGTPSANQYGPKPVPNTTGVILAAFSPIIFAVLFGILGAIAVPAYQSYVQKAAEAQEQAVTPTEAVPE